jgi:hypothetical protein
MPHPGAAARHRPNRHRRAKVRRPRPPWLRPMLAIFAVLSVLMPVTWMLFRNDFLGVAANNEVPYVEWVDDRYASASPKVADWSSDPTESQTPSKQPTESPTDSPDQTPTTPTTTPSGDPSTTPTTSPTDPTSRPTSSDPTRRPNRPRPPNPPTSPTPSTPSDDGNMDPLERELFDLIGGARAENGCAPLRPDSNLTESARSHAQVQAESGDTETGSGTDAISGESDAREAYKDLMKHYSSVLLDCSMDRLGIGRRSHEYCGDILCPLTGKDERTRWVADLAKD